MEGIDDDASLCGQIKTSVQMVDLWEPGTEGAAFSMGHTLLVGRRWFLLKQWGFSDSLARGRAEVRMTAS